MAIRRDRKTHSQMGQERGSVVSVLVILFIAGPVLSHTQTAISVGSCGIAPRRVSVFERGHWTGAWLRCETVKEALDAMKIAHQVTDIITPSLDTRLATRGRTNIRVVHVETRERVATREMLFKVEFKHEPTLRGRTRIERAGEKGLSEQRLRETLHDGKVVATRVVEDKLVREPQSQIVSVGRNEILPSRGLSIRKVVVMAATGYSADPRECPRSSHGRTATGLKAGYGIVAVDPKVIKMGTRLYIEGYGYAIAADKGGAIKGMRIDLGHDNHGDALKVGRRAVRVHILE